MKTCIFSKYLPIHLKGGMESHVRDLVNGLVKRGHRITIITAPHPQGIKKEEKENLTIYYLRNEPKYLREKFYRKSAQLFKELNKKEKFDIVHSQSTLGCGYAKYCKKTVPLILTSHGTALNEIKTILEGKSSLKHFLTVPIWLKMYLLDDPIIFKKADKIIVVSNEIKKDIKRQYKVPEEKLVVIPNGIDTNKFKPIPKEDLKERWRLGEQKIILCVGNIRKIKGYQLLIKILPQLVERQRTKLIIVGEGVYLNNLKKLAKDLKVSADVIFTGKVPDKKLVQLYNLADVSILPSLWHSEAFGIVNAEAMACETPVIASRIGGIPTVIDNYENGILVKPGNLEELKDKILEVINNQNLAKTLGENARRKVLEKFSLDKMVEDTIKVYRGVLTGK